MPTHFPSLLAPEQWSTVPVGLGEGADQSFPSGWFSLPLSLAFFLQDHSALSRPGRAQTWADCLLGQQDLGTLSPWLLPSSGFAFPQGIPPASFTSGRTVPWVVHPTAHKGTLRPRFGGGPRDLSGNPNSNDFVPIIIPNEPLTPPGVTGVWHWLWEVDSLRSHLPVLPWASVQPGVLRARRRNYNQASGRGMPWSNPSGK